VTRTYGRIFRAWQSGTGETRMLCRTCRTVETITRLPHDAATIHSRFFHVGSLHLEGTE
jgi:hypothetical protein